ncbi:MAG: hypothetical protein RIS70_3953 [Planctomycetota bacterium]
MSHVPPPVAQPVPAYNQPPKKSGCGCGCMGCLGGCLGVLLLVLVACGVGGYMFNKQVPTIIRESTASILRDAKVEPVEREAITQQMERFASAYESNSITWEQIGEIVSELGESPLVDTVILVAVEAQYFDKSGLDEDEKAAGRSALRRLARGAMDKQVARSEIAQLLDQITVNPGSGANNRQLKPQLTDEELREFLTQCKALADLKGIPEGDQPFRASRELKRIFDKTLGPSPDQDTDADDVIKLDPEPAMPDDTKPDEPTPDEPKPDPSDRETP